jgi:hypothetical protein
MGFFISLLRTSAVLTLGEHQLDAADLVPILRWSVSNDRCGLAITDGST